MKKERKKDELKNQRGNKTGKRPKPITDDALTEVIGFCVSRAN